MEISRPADAPSFLALVGPLLERDEARNQLALGIAGTLVERPTAYEVARFWVARSGTYPLAAALRTSPHDLVLADPADPEALDPLLDAVLADDPDLPGVLGNAPFVEEAARRLASETGRHAEAILSQGVFALERLREVPRASGAARAADETDRPLIRAWNIEFLTEAVPRPESHLARVDHTIDTVFEADSAGYWLWLDDGEPVSMSGFGGRTPRGIRIGPVYTPPERRGRGYATSLVAELTRWQLEHGRERCFLFTDLANPTSNHIYEDIGYERVCDSAVYRFGPR
jgi:predicted GNAT family acetyltransferase